MILDYNRTKGGVDTLDQNVQEFSCQRKTCRWSLLLFFNLLNVATKNAFILAVKSGCDKSRRQFLSDLTIGLAHKHVVRRYELNWKYLPRHTTSAIEILFDVQQKINESPVPSQSTVRRCFQCGKHTRSQCNVCTKHICNEHRVLVKYSHCHDCTVKLI